MTLDKEIVLFLLALAGGGISAFIYDLFRIRRKTFNAPVFFVKLEDILFWMIATAIISSIIFLGNDGEVRGFIVIGILVGVATYLIFLSKFVMVAFLTVIQWIKIILSFVFKPVIMLLSFIFKPLSASARIMKKSARKMRFFLDVQGFKLGLSMRSIKKTFKKI